MSKNKRFHGLGKVSQFGVAGDVFGLEQDDIRFQSPVRACEAQGCNVERPSSDMINVILTIGSPGHHSLAPMQHPDEEFWACSPEHWKELAHKLVDEMYLELNARHEVTAGSVHKK